MSSKKLPCFFENLIKQQQISFFFDKINLVLSWIYLVYLSLDFRFNLLVLWIFPWKFKRYLKIFWWNFKIWRKFLNKTKKSVKKIFSIWIRWKFCLRNRILIVSFHFSNMFPLFFSFFWCSFYNFLHNFWRVLSCRLFWFLSTEVFE